MLSESNFESIEVFLQTINVMHFERSKKEAFQLRIVTVAEMWANSQVKSGNVFEKHYQEIFYPPEETKSVGESMEEVVGLTGIKIKMRKE